MPVTLVERAVELERLDGFLAQALAGKGQLVFVRGEGGAGKTTLLGLSPSALWTLMRT
ncbi:hypothetical protein BH18ACT6_BH18ACT6_20270 [soil metagenome]